MKYFALAGMTLALPLSAEWTKQLIVGGVSPVGTAPTVAMAHRSKLSWPYGTKEFTWIAYQNRITGTIVAAKSTSSGWILYDIETLSQTGGAISIAVDKDGNPWVAYEDKANERYRVARLASTVSGNCGPNATWSCETLTKPSFWTGVHKGAIKIAVQDQYHGAVLFTTVDNILYPNEIRTYHAKLDGGNWYSMFYAPGPIGPGPKERLFALDLDADGLPQKLARRDNSKLDWDPLAAGPAETIKVGDFFSFFYGAHLRASSSSPKACFVEGGPLADKTRVKYASRSAAVWSIETAAVKAFDPALGVPFIECAVGSQSDGKPAIAYGDRHLKYLYFSRQLNPTTWSRELVDSVGDTGYSISFAKTLFGQPFLVYSNAGGDIYIARRN